MKIGEMSDAIIEMLKEYGDDVIKAVDKTVEKETKKGAKILKETSPKLTGDYRKGWASKTVKKPLGSEGTVYNKTEYRLTHLLENGHAKRGGGRVKAIPHIAPANDELHTMFESDLRKAIGEIR